MPRLSLFKRFCLMCRAGSTIVLFGALFLSTLNDARAQHSHGLQVVLELSDIDEGTISDTYIIETCTTALKDRHRYSSAEVARILRARGNAFASSNKLESALKDLGEVCSLIPSDGEAIALKATVLLKLGRTQDAWESVQNAIKLNNRSPYVHLVAAAVQAQKRDLASAAEHLLAAEKLNPKYALTIYNSSLLCLADNPQAALSLMDQYLRLSPWSKLGDPARPYFHRGCALAMLNRTEESLSSFLMSWRLRKGSETAQDIAICYALLGRFHLAVHYSREGVRLAPKNARRWAYAAKFHANAGLTEEAARLCQKALELPDKDALVRSIIGEAFFANGDYAKARDCFRKSLETDAEDVELRWPYASFLATCPDAKYRDGVLAVKHARAICERSALPKWRKGEPTMAWAEACAETGAFAEAIRHAREALEIVGPDYGGRPGFLARLECFENFQPWRAKVGKAPSEKQK